MAVIILARSNQNYRSVAPMSQGHFWSPGTQEFWLPTLTPILVKAWKNELFLIFFGGRKLHCLNPHYILLVGCI
jgi:hypothetical protein